MRHLRRHIHVPAVKINKDTGEKEMNLEKNGSAQGSPVRPQQSVNQRQVNTQ